MQHKLFALCVVVAIALSTGCHSTNYHQQAEEVLYAQIIDNANWALQQEPQGVTSAVCSRSAGGAQDFYSEGDYWWPDPESPEGPYIRRDGETNPEIFITHRHLMIRFSQVVGNLASGYMLTGNEEYVQHAFRHINTWLVDTATRMNPSLEYAQAIKGIVTGRGIGIIDAIHLIEVSQGILRMQHAKCVEPHQLAAAKQWFSEYLQWVTTHQYGLDEMNAKNNHGTCWVMQVAAFAKLTGNNGLLAMCAQRYKTVLLPQQMATNGSFPLETSRTKPYGYSLFNLDAMATVCQILSTPSDNLWQYSVGDSLCMRKGVEYMYPYIQDKSQWPFAPDVMHWDEWPVAQPALLFAANAFKDQRYFDLWKRLKHPLTVDEVIRNVPIRNPLIWIE